MSVFDTKFDEENKIWRGADIQPFHSKLSLGHAILCNLQKMPNKISQISADTGIQLTNRDLYTKTIRAAQNIQRLGIQKNDVFSFVARNSHHLAPIVFAAFCLGCPINPLDTTFSKTEFVHMLKITKPKLVFCDVKLLELVEICLQDLQNNAKIYTFGGTSGRSVAVEDLFAETQNEAEYIVTDIDGENHIAAINCSSGTTGLPKAICVSHAAHLHQLANNFHFTEDDVVLCYSTLHWQTGLFMLLTGPLLGTTRIITTEPFSAEQQLYTIEKYKVTRIFSAAYHIVQTINCENLGVTDLSSVRQIMSGGCKLPIEIYKQLNDYLPNGQVNIVYGFTECGGIISVDEPFSGRDCVGKLSANTQLKIIDSSGKRCGINEKGEICIKSLYRFLGYYRNEEATKIAIDNEGFLLTDDVGFFDDDGYLNFVDRKKDLLKHCGMHISPIEIENYLLQVEGIKVVCVVGIDDLKWEHLPAAVVVRNDEGQINEDEIDRLVSEHFADFKRLRGGIFFVESLPMTPSGKILRRKVKNIAEHLYNTNQAKNI